MYYRLCRWFRNRAIKGTDDKIQFTGSLPFFNTVDQGGVAKDDPLWFYAKKALIASEQKRLDAATPNNTVKVTNSYFEIEGFRKQLNYSNLLQMMLQLIITFRD
jgi:hypothetical protein